MSNTITKDASLVGKMQAKSAQISGSMQPRTNLSGKMTLPKIVYEDLGVHTPATKNALGLIIVGDNLNITKEGVLSVNVATEAEQDNTQPITSAAVNTLVGNINVLLQLI